MSESQEPEQTEQAAQDAPDTTGGVFRVSHPAAGPVARPHEPEQKPLEDKREDVRGRLAQMLMLLFGLTLGAGFVLAYVGGEIWMEGRDYFQLALTAVTSLLGSAIGFYFGSHKQ